MRSGKSCNGYNNGCGSLIVIMHDLLEQVRGRIDPTPHSGPAGTACLLPDCQLLLLMMTMVVV